MNVLVSIALPDDLISKIKSEHSVTVHHGNQPMDPEELRSLLRGKHGILCTITDKIDRELLNNTDRLMVVANYGVGYDNIDLEACTEKGVLVTNTPDVLTDATADLAMALILAVARRVVEGDLMVRENRFQAWTPFGFLGSEVSGKTLGIVGLGRIGKAVARRAHGFSMKVLYYNRNRLAPEHEQDLGVQYVDFMDLLQESDFVSIHVPLTRQTHHMIGTKELAAMKSGAYLINTSRGPVVDEGALVNALRNGHIAGAALDVYEREPLVHPELLKMKNTVLLPHLGSATSETRRKMAQRAIENLLAALRNERPRDCLNWEQLNKATP